MGAHISVNENCSSVGVSCHTAQYLTSRLPPPTLTTCSLVREAFQVCWHPASKASGRPPAPASWLHRPRSVDTQLRVSSFHNSIWRLRGFFLSSTHFRFSRASASCVHETPCWLFPTLARPSTDLSGSVTRQPIKHYTVWQPFKSQKVTITILTVDVLITVD